MPKPVEENPYNPANGKLGTAEFLFVVTTYRLTEHHWTGGLTR